jgi:hypothetical protein
MIAKEIERTIFASDTFCRDYSPLGESRTKSDDGQYTNFLYVWNGWLGTKKQSAAIV